MRVRGFSIAAAGLKVRAHNYFVAAKKQLRSVLDVSPMAFTPDGLSMPIPAPTQAFSEGGSKSVNMEWLERDFWLYAIGDRNVQVAPLLQQLMDSKNTELITRLLDEALNDKVTPLQIGAKLGLGQGSFEEKGEFSKRRTVIYLGFNFFVFQENWQQAVLLGEPLLRIMLTERTRSRKNIKLQLKQLPPEQTKAEGVTQLQTCIQEEADLRAEAEAGQAYFLAMAYLGLGQQTSGAKRAKGYFRKAKQHVLFALNVNPKNEDALSLLFDANQLLGLHKENFNWVTDALQARKNQPSTRLAYEVCRLFITTIVDTNYHSPKIVAQAIEWFERVAANKAGLEEKYVQRFDGDCGKAGVVYCLHGDYEKAIYFIAQAVQWQTEKKLVYYMAFAQYKHGNTEEAKKLVKELEKMDQEYPGLAELKKQLFPAEAEKVATPNVVVVENLEPAAEQKNQHLISGEEVRNALLGENSANIDSIFTSDRATRQFITEALQTTLSEYIDLIEKEDWAAVQSLVLPQVTTLSFSDPELMSVLEILGIEKIEVHPADSREVRLYLVGEQFRDKYYSISIDDDLSFGFFESPNLREIKVLLQAIVLEEIFALVEGQSLGEVMDSLKARLQQPSAEEQIDWAALGRQAKVERVALAERQAAEEAELLRKLKGEETRSLEHAFLTQNQNLYLEISQATDDLGIKLLDLELSTNRIITTCLAWLNTSRKIGEPVYSFEEAVPQTHPLFSVVKKVVMYGPTRAREVLAAKNLQLETIEALGFTLDPLKSPFFGVYDLECEINGESFVLTTLLDAKGEKLVVLGLPAEQEQELLSDVLRRIVLERLTYKTTRLVKDTYGVAEPAPDGLTTEKAEILRGVALALEKEMGPILPTPKRKEQESQATAAQLMEFYRIVTQPRGLSQEPLYVQQGGMYRRIRVEDRRYRKLIALPAAERFVKMEPGVTFRLKLGPVKTPAPRSSAVHDPFYYLLHISPEGELKIEPDWEPLTLEKITWVSSPKTKARSLMGYRISDEKKAAYLGESATRLESDLSSNWMVYAFAVFNNDGFVWIPRDITGQTIADIQTQLFARPNQLQFLQQFMRGEIDELRNAVGIRRNEQEWREAGVKHRFIMAMETHRGFWEGGLWSHERFNQFEAAMNLTSV